MKLLDLFCGAGGATKGYQRAGFHVVGVDIEPQPNYCGDEFVQADALEFMRDLLYGSLYLPWRLGDFDAIHASPPCQRYTTMGQRFATTQAEHPDLIAATREALEASGLPYVIENVMGARREMVAPVRLCGSSFGLGVHRHRLFETNRPLMVPPCSHGGESGVAVYGKLDGRRVWTRSDGTELRAAVTVEEAQGAMGIDWMTWPELTQAIPPAYTELIGHQLRQHIEANPEAVGRGVDAEREGAATP